jgi:hypothetical protein
MNFSTLAQQAAGLVLALVLAVGGVGVVLALLVRGIWGRIGEPAVRSVLAAWYTDPEQVKHRKAEVVEVIDNELKRVDGKIRTEITQQVVLMEGKLLAALNDLKTLIQQDNQHQHQVLNKLNRMEGQIDVLLNQKTSGNHGHDSDDQ